MTVIIGIDPHKATHMAVAIDGDEQPVARLEVTADRRQTQRLLAWAAPLGTERRGRSSPPTGSASCCPNSCSPRVNTSSMCHPRCRHGCGCWARRRRRRTTPTTRCRPRSPGCVTVGYGRCGATITRRCCGCWSAVTTTSRVAHPGRMPAAVDVAGTHRWWCTTTLVADRAAKLLRRVHPEGVVASERKRLARRAPRRCAPSRSRASHRTSSASATPSTASATTLLELHGVGPIVAALILAHVGDPARFATPERFASYNGTAPIEASSGPRKRHRLNPRGNRKLNHAMHIRGHPDRATTPQDASTTNARSPKARPRRKRCAR